MVYSVNFPSGEGIKRCVMVECVGWFEVFFEEVFVGFVWLLLILVAMRGRDTPLAPLERGGLECCFFI